MKQAVIIFLLVTSAVLCQAQDAGAKNKRGPHPDFSGTWQLDRLKSELSQKVIALSGPAVTLTITHREPELRIVQTTAGRGETTTRQVLYHTDGTGETNPPLRSYLSRRSESQLAKRDLAPVPSKSEWHGKKLKIRSAVVVLVSEGKQSTVKTEEVWEILSDGETLVQTISFSVKHGQAIHFEPSRMRKVFHRVPTS